MFKLNNFFNQTYAFTKTLIIKNHHAAMVMETKHRTETFDPYANEDMRTWKYYLNVSGERHPTDPEVKIKVIETSNEEILTKELLELYKVTASELMKCGYYYNNLIKNNKDMFLYIHGCLTPIDIDYAIEAIDGTILSYNNTLIEPNETNLIPGLQKWLYNYHYTWFNGAYTITDPLYLPSFLGVMYANIPNVITNLRLLNTKTNKTHSFFLEAYFNSRFELWNHISKLNQETIWWLYRHIDYIIKNIGKNSTFQLLLDKVFQPNNIGIGGYNLEYLNYELNKNFFNPNKLPYDTNGSILNKVKLNDSFLISKEGDTVNIDQILTDQLTNTEHTMDRKAFIKNVYIDEINSKVNVSSVTKILELSSLKTFNIGTIDVYSILIDYWGYLLSHNLYGSLLDDEVTTAKIDFKDPNTDDDIILTSKTGFLLLIKILFRAIGKEDLPIEKFVYGRVFNPSNNPEHIFEKTLYRDGYTQTLKDTMVKDYPVIDQAFTSNFIIGEYLTGVINYYKNLWMLDANAENPIVSSNIKYFIFLSQLNEEYKVHNSNTPETIDTLLAKNGLTIRFTEDYDYDKTIKEIFKVCLGVDLRTTEKVVSLIEDYKAIIRKLTSYTLQTYGSYEHEEKVGLNYNNIGLLFTTKGIVNLFPGRVDGEGLSNTYATSAHIAYDPSERPKKYYSVDAPYLHVCDEKHLKGGYLSLDDRPITTSSVTFTERINGEDTLIGVYVNPIYEMHSTRVDPFIHCEFEQPNCELFDNKIMEADSINSIPAFFTPCMEVREHKFNDLQPKLRIIKENELIGYGREQEDIIRVDLPTIHLED